MPTFTHFVAGMRAVFAHRKRLNSIESAQLAAIVESCPLAALWALALAGIPHASAAAMTALAAEKAM